MSHRHLIPTIEKGHCIKNTMKQLREMCPDCKTPRTTQQKMRQILYLNTVTKLPMCSLGVDAKHEAHFAFAQRTPTEDN